MGGVSGRSSVTDSPSRNTHQFFVQLSLSQRAETEVSLSIDAGCVIEHYNTNDVPNKAETNYTSNITKHIKMKDGIFKATLSSDAVDPSN